MVILKKEDEPLIMDMGALRYSAKRIAELLDLPKEDVKSAMKDNQSELSKLLKKGKDHHAFLVDRKLLERAASGDLAAIKKVEMRQRSKD